MKDLITKINETKEIFTKDDFEYLLKAINVYSWGKHDYFINKYEIEDLYKKVWEEACKLDKEHFDKSEFGHGDIHKFGYND